MTVCNHRDNDVMTIEEADATLATEANARTTAEADRIFPATSNEDATARTTARVDTTLTATNTRMTATPHTNPVDPRVQNVPRIQNRCGITNQHTAVHHLTHALPMPG